MEVAALEPVHRRRLSHNVLRLEVQDPLEGLHVDGHREMFMSDHPLARDLTKTNGRAHPDISVFSACPLSSDSVKTAAEGHIASP